MLMSVPQEVDHFLNAASLAAEAAFFFTGKGRAILAADLPTVPGCPQCGSPLGIENRYVGGRGYQPYEICTREGCAHERRAW